MKELKKNKNQTMEYFEAVIYEAPQVFLENFKELSFIEQCKLKAFIQCRDTILYNKMIEVIGE